VALGAIEAPKAATKSVDAVKAVLALEERVTAALQAIHKLADEAGDGQTCSLMLDYLSEQTEGEDMARQVLAFFEAAGDIVTFDQQVSTLL
jgi:ferritin